MLNNFFNIFDSFDDFDSFGDFDSFFSAPQYQNPHKQVKKCSCGRTYADFEKSGRLGCDKCYDTFRNELNVLLRQIHSNNVHRGKIPSNCLGDINKKRLYENLKAQLEEAVRNEDYERAAKLHKEIKAMDENK